jgi:ABC-2 type transport system permease protein
VAGFTVFKLAMTLMVLGAVWGLLTSTRLLRGEEDAGRWDLLLAGETTPRRASAQALGGLGAGAFVLWVVTAALTVLTGRASDVGIAAGPALYFALAMVSTAVMFLAVGACASQLGATRRQAASYAAVFLGIAYAVRMVADAGVGVHWLIWFSPLGWVEELRPLTDPNPVALVPIVGFTALGAVVTVHLAGRRDVGASVVPDRTTGSLRKRFLGSPTGLAVRLLRPAVIGWWVAIGISGLLYGFIAKSAGGTISGSVSQILAKFGASGGGASAVLGVCFFVMAVLVAFVASGQLTAARSEEAEGRLDHLLVRPVSRTRWLGGRLGVAATVIVVSGVGAGFSCWLGVVSQHAGVGLPSLLAAGVNLVPPALLILGMGALVYGARPRLASRAVYGLLAWSVLVKVVGGIGAVSHWVLDTSVFHHMAAAPAVSPNWTANAAMTGIGLAAALAGGLLFHRRDLQGN